MDDVQQLRNIGLNMSIHNLYLMNLFYTKEDNAVTADADAGGIPGVVELLQLFGSVGLDAPGKYIWWLAIEWCALECRGGKGVGLARNWPTAVALCADDDGWETGVPVPFSGSVQGVPPDAAATAAARTALLDAATWCAACAWAAAAAAAWRLAILF